MWVVFEPVKKKEMLEKIYWGLPGRFDIAPVKNGWKLSLWIGKTRDGRD